MSRNGRVPSGQPKAVWPMLLTRVLFIVAAIVAVVIVRYTTQNDVLTIIVGPLVYAVLWLGQAYWSARRS